MTTDDLFAGVLDWHQKHGQFPQRGYLSLADVETMLKRPVLFDAQVPLQFASHAMGVTEWFIDPVAEKGSLRFEAAPESI